MPFLQWTGWHDIGVTREDKGFWLCRRALANRPQIRHAKIIGARNNVGEDKAQWREARFDDVLARRIIGGDGAQANQVAGEGKSGVVEHNWTS